MTRECGTRASGTRRARRARNLIGDATASGNEAMQWSKRARPVRVQWQYKRFSAARK
jgi:hypothetical protein